MDATAHGAGDAGGDTGADTGTGPVVGLLLAAGGGRRLGGHPKALLEAGGRLLVERGVAALREGGCERVHVVLGARAEQVREQVTRRAAAREGEPGAGAPVWVGNPGWEAGMGSSLRAGLDSLAATDAGAALVLLVDQPGIGAAAVARVRAAHRGPRTLVAAAYAGRRGHPVLFGRAHWAGVAEGARGDRGARDYLRERAGELTLVECGGLAEPYDIDTAEDLWRLDAL